MWVFCSAMEATPEALRCPVNLIFDKEKELCSALRKRFVAFDNQLRPS